MKTYYKFLLAFIFLSFAFISNAQWYKLQAYKDPFAGNTSIQPNSSSYPAWPLVSGNGRIIYIGSAWVLNFQQMIIAESSNDLNSITNECNCGDLYVGYSATSKNDSTYAFYYSQIVTLDSSQAYLYYTSNNFSTGSLIPITGTPVYPPANSSCLSNNYAYSAFETNDTGKNNIIVFCRTSPSTGITTYYNYSKYADPISMAFTSDSVGYMLCIYHDDSSKSVIVRTPDSGKIWTDNYIDSVNAITSFCFPSPNIGFLTENNGAVYKTINAGSSWTKLVSPTSIQLNCISFANDSVGYIGGNSGVLYKTTTGGKTWTNANSGTTNTIVALYTFGDSIAYFKDAGNSLYKNVSPLGIETLNGGNNVIDIYPNPSNGKFSVAIKNYELGITNSIEVYNMLGERIIPSSVIPNSQFVIDLSGQPNGIYFYRVISEDQSLISSGKLEIQH